MLKRFSNKTFAKIISFAILILPMFFLWKSVDENKAFRYWEPRQFIIINPDFTRELVFLIALIGTGVGSGLTSLTVYMFLTSKFKSK